MVLRLLGMLWAALAVVKFIDPQPLRDYLMHQLVLSDTMANAGTYLVAAVEGVIGAACLLGARAGFTARLSTLLSCGLIGLAWLAPSVSCGCLGAASDSAARRALVAGALLTLSALAVLEAGANGCRHQRVASLGDQWYASCLPMFPHPA